MQKLNNEQFNMFVNEYVRLSDIYYTGTDEQIKKENKNESNIYLDKSLLYIYGCMIEIEKIFNKLTGFDLSINTGDKIKTEKLRQQVVELSIFERKEFLIKELEGLQKERNNYEEIIKALLSEKKYKTEHAINEWEQLEINGRITPVYEVQQKIEIYSEYLRDVEKQIEIVTSELKE